MKETDLARQLLLSAERDLKALRNMIDPEVFADEVFGFHAQQTAEKSLKAWIALLGGEYPFVHDLDALLTKLETLDVETERFRVLIELNAFAVQFRYEAFDSIDDPLDRKTVLSETESLFTMVRTLLI
jgi:HEPN domain-containing protein